MTDKELIKQEIEKRFNDNMKASEQYAENSKSRALFTSAAKEDYDLLAFIESLPEEPASEDLEEEIDRFEEWLNSYNQSDYPTSYTLRDIARHFAEWQKQQLIDKACDYLQKNIWRVNTEENEFHQRFVTDFKNYMQNE